MVLIDTPVWSEIFRKRRPDPSVLAHVRQLSDRDTACVIGPIRQEVLSGIRVPADFLRLQTLLRAIRELRILPEDYDRAAGLFNDCRAAGVQGAHVDFLIVAVAQRAGAAVYSFDQDFEHYQKAIFVPLHGGPRPSARA